MISLVILIGGIIGAIWLIGFAIIKGTDYYDRLPLSNDHNDIIGLNIAVGIIALAFSLIIGLAYFSMYLFSLELEA